MRAEDLKDSGSEESRIASAVRESFGAAGFKQKDTFNKWRIRITRSDIHKPYRQAERLHKNLPFSDIRVSNGVAAFPRDVGAVADVAVVWVVRGGLRLVQRRSASTRAEVMREGTALIFNPYDYMLKPLLLERTVVVILFTREAPSGLAERLAETPVGLALEADVVRRGEPAAASATRGPTDDLVHRVWVQRGETMLQGNTARIGSDELDSLANFATCGFDQLLWTNASACVCADANGRDVNVEPRASKFHNILKYCI